LGRVWCGGIDANAAQVRRGMAWVFDRYVKDRSLYPLQDAARSARLGLWADAAPVPPWKWRKTKGVLEYRAPVQGLISPAPRTIKGQVLQPPLWCGLSGWLPGTLLSARSFFVLKQHFYPAAPSFALLGSQYS
jgi:hypothetical protein